MVAGELVKHNAASISELYKKCSQQVSREQVAEAEQLAQAPRPDERLVALIGLSGAGKSSVICSLLGIKDIAITGGDGRAVTCFPVYYRDDQGTNTTKYKVQCLFRNVSKIEEILESLLDDINAAFNDEVDILATSQEKQSRSEEAEASIRTLFGKMQGFDYNKLLIHNDQVTKASALRTISRWASFLTWPGDMVNGLCERHVEDENALQEIIKGCCDNGMWPLIERVTIYLDSALLKNGVVLIDLPGSHDANYFRGRIARQTQQRCNDVFVVSQITRATDNPILAQVVKENTPRSDAEVVRLQTVTAVCTHSANTSSDIEHMADRHQLRVAKARLDELEDAEDPPCSQVRKAERHLLRIQMAGRNRHVKEEMHKTYGSKMGKNQFNIFCVDNKMYMDPRGRKLCGDDQEDLSGIRGLQQHVDDLPARRLFEANNAIIGWQYNAMICSFETWVSGCRAEPHALTSVLPEPKALKNFEQTLQQWVDLILAQFDRLIVEHLQYSANEIATRALDAMKEWKNIPHSTIRALCRKEGYHISGGRRGRIEYDWNRELISAFESVAQRNWGEFAERLREDLSALHRSINQAFQVYPQLCERLGAPAHFLQSIMSRQTGLDRVAGVARDSFLGRLGELRRDFAISQEMCYVKAVMQPVYRECLEDGGTYQCSEVLVLVSLRLTDLSGKGVTRRNLEDLANHVWHSDFVGGVCTRLQKDFQEATQECSAELLEKIQATTRAIEADVDNLQGKRDQLPLFLVHPEFGREAEALLVSLKENKKRVNDLARPARRQAVKLYGPEILQ